MWRDKSVKGWQKEFIQRGKNDLNVSTIYTHKFSVRCVDLFDSETPFLSLFLCTSGTTLVLHKWVLLCSSREVYRVSVYARGFVSLGHSWSESTLLTLVCHCARISVTYHVSKHGLSFFCANVILNGRKSSFRTVWFTTRTVANKSVHEDLRRKYSPRIKFNH